MTTPNRFAEIYNAIMILSMADQNNFNKFICINPQDDDTRTLIHAFIGTAMLFGLRNDDQDRPVHYSKVYKPVDKGGLECRNRANCQYVIAHSIFIWYFGKLAAYKQSMKDSTENDSFPSRLPDGYDRCSGCQFEHNKGEYLNTRQAVFNYMNDWDANYGNQGFSATWMAISNVLKFIVTFLDNGNTVNNNGKYREAYLCLFQLNNLADFQRGASGAKNRVFRLPVPVFNDGIFFQQPVEQEPVEEGVPEVIHAMGIVDELFPELNEIYGEKKTADRENMFVDKKKENVDNSNVLKNRTGYASSNESSDDEE